MRRSKSPLGLFSARILPCCPFFNRQGENYSEPPEKRVYFEAAAREIMEEQGVDISSSSMAEVHCGVVRTSKGTFRVHTVVSLEGENM